jgi:hypothetical protein
VELPGIAACEHRQCSRGREYVPRHGKLATGSSYPTGDREVIEAFTRMPRPRPTHPTTRRFHQSPGAIPCSRSPTTGCSVRSRCDLAALSEGEFKDTAHLVISDGMIPFTRVGEGARLRDGDSLAGVVGAGLIRSTTMRQHLHLWLSIVAPSVLDSLL